MSKSLQKRLLLHSCCAPCSSAVLHRLVPDYDVTLFFYNPNILPEREYFKRLSEQKRLLQCMGLERDVNLIIGSYHPALFKKIITGLESLPENSERCIKCYTLRLEESAKIAVSYGFELFTTTLTLSSKKDAEQINQVMAKVATKYSLKRLWADFKKDDGYNLSIELCNKYRLERQKYCGCKVVEATIPKVKPL